MKSLFQLGCRLSFIFIFILAISCKKDSYVDEENELVYPVNFTFTNFKSSTSFLKTASLKNQFRAANSVPANYSEGFIYFWSFNNETLVPDVKYFKSANPSITYNNGKQITYGAGFAFEGYTAGRAANFVGPSEILLKFPIKDVLSLSRLGFDMTGSAMGPKDFDLYYSFDEGDTYHILAMQNQFGNLAGNGKNSFTYNLEDLEIQGTELWIRINPKEGNREGGSAYSSTSGTLRIDNLHLVGISPTSTDEFTINKLYYYLYNKENGQGFQGVNDDLTNLDLQLELPEGEYDVFFVINSSNDDLIIAPDIGKAPDIYISNPFSNKDAEIFGYKGTLEVSGNMSVNIVLQRLYSQVKVEFTDQDLSAVKKIVLNQLHEPFFYSPFATGLLNPILDQSAIEIEDDFQSNKQVIFNQFMGLLNENKPVNYILNVIGDAGVLQSFELSSSLKNNIQLVFRGNLLEGAPNNVAFQITKNENWDGENEVSF